MAVPVGEVALTAWDIACHAWVAPIMEDGPCNLRV